jgi:hypothetical protein
MANPLVGTGERESPPPRNPRAGKRGRKNPKLDVAVGLLAVVALPWMSSQVDDIGEKRIIAVVWLAVCFGLLFVGVRGIVRRSRATTTRRQAEAPSNQVQPVAWLMAPAASSPSRADAMRELPEYSARMMGPVQNRN